MLVKMVTKKVDVRYTEFALLLIYYKSVFIKALEQKFEMIQVFFLVKAENGYVIEICITKP